ncbi:MAG: type II toxin-antitoxin system HicA family toxin [Clostridia bacterium]|nr:type II toxin-antitoxin system HicA family toxin [Clostridia bacterium]
MSTIEKLIQRVLSVPSDLSYDELKNFLSYYNFIEDTKGKTSGSRVRFMRQHDSALILLHKPHPSNIVGRKTIRAVIENLKERGDLNE